jgi:crotonobetainyl-CoA:carnitine CoA-transferase CaiB-like acyl-CoA transferase
MSPAKPFEGLRVIELATVLAGPLVGTFFAELGAEVLKFENPKTGGDTTRHWKLPSEKTEEAISAYYAAANWGKTSSLLDLTIVSEKEKLLEFLSLADILIVNFKAGDSEKLGLSFAELSLRFPRLIYAHITGYGNKNPRPAYDLALQAETGFMSMNGTPESGPLKMPVAMIDLLAAHQLKEGVLTALYQREKTGKGLYVHVSLYDAAIASLANQASNFLMAGYEAGLNGSLHPNIAPYGETFRTHDGLYFVLAVGSDSQFNLLSKAIEMPELYFDPRFDSNQNRVLNRSFLFEILTTFFSTKTLSEIDLLLQKAAVPFSSIKSISQALQNSNSAHLIVKTLETTTIRTAVFELKTN